MQGENSGKNIIKFLSLTPYYTLPKVVSVPAPGREKLSSVILLPSACNGSLILLEFLLPALSLLFCVKCSNVLSSLGKCVLELEDVAGRGNVGFFFNCANVSTLEFTGRTTCATSSWWVDFNLPWSTIGSVLIVDVDGFIVGATVGLNIFWTDCWDSGDGMMDWSKPTWKIGSGPVAELQWRLFKDFWGEGH